VALQLKKLGIVHVRPLAGGLAAWRAAGLPLTPFPALDEAGPAR
jgi:rhodanese-related sulfurtransferase